MVEYLFGGEVMSEEESDTEEYCPTQNGNIVGYRPEFLMESEGDWREVGTHVSKCGIPGDRYYSGILNTIGLFSYEQAMAVAWTFSAEAAAHGESCEVRVKEFIVTYDIKAKEVPQIDQ